MRATELAKMLSLNAETVAQMLLPNGKRKAAEWECGDLNGASGDSLKVRLTGSKAGVWSDFASGESGDLIGLWMAVRGLSLKEACDQAKDYLGVQDEAPLKAKQLYNRPNKSGVTNLTTAHVEWLTVTRGISAEVLKLYRIASKGEWIAFPSIRDGELIACKYRKMNKEFLQDAGCEPCLFGWQAVSPKSRKILICEGEMDALAWASYGIPALSVPMGAGTGAKHNWIENEFAHLSNMDIIYLSMDMDVAGQDSIAELVQRLGSERVRVVSLPEKDANKCLMEGVPQGVIDKALADASSLDPQELRKASSFEEAVIAETYRRDEGLTLPWLKTHDLIRLRDGEVSVWGGINGHGKSNVIDNVVVDVSINQGTVVLAASLEYRAAKWLHRLSTIACGLETPSDEFRRACFKRLSNNLMVFDVPQSAKAKRIMEVFRYASKRYGVKFFLIDNLTKCGFDDDDYSGQKNFVEELSDFARTENVHIAIVMHMRKGETGEEKPSGKFGFKGSGGITDMASTVIEVWRNKKKEKEALKSQTTGQPSPEADKPDTYLFVHKQRESGFEPTIALWFHQKTLQFLGASHHKPNTVGGMIRMADGH